jgi:hypothetical protein
VWHHCTYCTIVTNCAGNGHQFNFVCTEKTNTHTLDFFQQEASYPSSRNQVFEQSYLYISIYQFFCVFWERRKKNEKKPFDKKMCFVLKNHSASVLLYTSIENYNLRKNITKVNFKSLSQNVAILFLLFFRRHQHENMKRRKLLPFFCTVLETPKKYYYYTYNSIIWKIW